MQFQKQDAFDEIDEFVELLKEWAFFMISFVDTFVYTKVLIQIIEFEL